MNLRGLRLFACGTVLIVLLASSATATPALEGKDLADLSLEQLGDIVVWSVSKRPEPLAEAPASIYVITADAIRRAGATSIPDALRLAPNLDVARADANQYAISARGFNNVLANKLLVLIDGRVIYTPLFSGVFWEAQDVLLEDVDRIEVISGPGATLWGANAVNGVINIITKPVADTQGSFASAGMGDDLQGVAARYGGQLPGKGAYRVYGKHSHRDHSELADGTAVRDDSEHTQGGFRTEWNGAVHEVRVQGDVYEGDLDQEPAGRRIGGWNLIGRWQRRATNGSQLRVRVYYDHTERDSPGVFKEELGTFDLDLQHTLAAIGRHEIIWGAGYRSSSESIDNSPVVAFLPPDKTLRFSNIFVQDQIGLGSKVDLIVGAKLETNEYTNSEFLPSIRLSWRPAEHQLLWAAISRAVRAPSRVDRDFFTPATPPFALAGGPDFVSETANVYELGFRAQPFTALSYSVTLFHGDYDRLRSVGLSAAGAVFENNIEGQNEGVEGWGTLRVNEAWRISAGGVVQRDDLHAKPGSIALGGTTGLGNDPGNWWKLRSSVDVSKQCALDVGVRRYAGRPNPQVPSYLAVDANVAWKPIPALRIALLLQNLLDPGHPEWGTDGNRAEFGRAYFLNVAWTR